MTIAAAAAAYARAGYPVFPCRQTCDKARGSKSPWLPGESRPGAQDGGHWLASCEPERVAAWWRRWPGALIGFPTGARTGTVVIDLDPREAPVDEMAAALLDWCGRLRDDARRPALARTQSGGAHLYFAWDAARPLRNRTNVFSGFLAAGQCVSALAHIDVRGEGGYVIAPPSRMDNGAAYVWITRPDKAADGRWLLPPPPARLAGVIDHTLRPVAPPRPAPTPGARRAGAGRVARYVEAAVEGALAAARSAPEGQRNDAVFRAAMRLGQFVRSGHLEAGRAEQLLFANLPAGVSPGERKIGVTIRNGLAETRIPPFSEAEIGPGRRG